MSRLLAAVCAVAATGATAEAQRVYARVDLDGRASLGELDLAEQAGQEPAGDSQTSTVMGGFAVAVGLRSADIRAGLEAGLYRGGLDAPEIDELYFGSAEGSGRSVTATFGLAAAVDRPLRHRVIGVGRLDVGYALMMSESDSGAARVDTFFMDVGGGLGTDLDTAIPTRLEAVATFRVNRMHRFEVDGLTEGRIAADAPSVFVQPGLQLSALVFF